MYLVHQYSTEFTFVCFRFLLRPAIHSRFSSFVADYFVSVLSRSVLCIVRLLVLSCVGPSLSSLSTTASATAIATADAGAATTTALTMATAGTTATYLVASLLLLNPGMHIPGGCYSYTSAYILPHVPGIRYLAVLFSTGRKTHQVPHKFFFTSLADVNMLSRASL